LETPKIASSISAKAKVEAFCAAAVLVLNVHEGKRPRPSLLDLPLAFVSAACTVATFCSSPRPQVASPRAISLAVAVSGLLPRRAHGRVADGRAAGAVS
jgi:hypothetical protein